MTKRSKRKLTPGQRKHLEDRAEAALAGALRKTKNPAHWNRALLSAAKAIYPGRQNEKQAHDAHVTIRGAIVRYLTRGDVRR